MNTLEMAMELRKNPKLKAQCQVGNVIWKVKCVNGSIMWDDSSRPPEFLDMSNCILRHNNWSLIEENKLTELYFIGAIRLINGIGNLPENIEPVGDIFVKTSNQKLHTIRPIGKEFAVPTDDNQVDIVFKYLRNCTHIIIK